MTSSHKQHIAEHEGYLYDKIPSFSKSDFVGLEIGFGTGDSILQVAGDNPSQTWVGVEVYELGVANVIRQAKLKGIDNICLRVGDVVEVLSEEFSDTSVNHIRIFFPDPWPKKRHHKRRLVQKDLLSLLYRVLKPQGVIHIATDNAHYAQACIELLENDTRFTIGDKALYRPQTKFAKKAQAQGVAITDITAYKQG